MTKTEAAFRLSAEKLFEENSEVYFWTFTMKDVLPDWYYSRVWARFARDLVDLYGGNIGGLKVVELHKEHGLHWHCLLNRRVWVGEVRRMASRYGIGRVHVVKATAGAVDYLCKYLSKQWAAEHKLQARVCKWGTVGSFRGTRVRDIKIEDAFHKRIEFCQKQLRLEKLPFLFVKALLDCPFPGVDEYRLRVACDRFESSGSISMLWDAVGRWPGQACEAKQMGLSGIEGRKPEGEDCAKRKKFIFPVPVQNVDVSKKEAPEVSGAGPYWWDRD